MKNFTTCLTAGRFALAAALMATLVPAPTFAQDTKAPSPSVEAESESLVTNDLTSQELEELLVILSEEPEIEEAIDELKAELLQTGEIEPGWNAKGIYLPNLLAKREGGVSEQAFISDDDGMIVIERFGDKPIPLPNGLYSFDLHDGALIRGDLQEHMLASFVPGFWFEVRSTLLRDDNALCYAPGFTLSVHTEQPPEAWRVEDLVMVAVMHAITRQMIDAEFCTVFQADGKDAVTGAVYTPDGRPYSALNAEDEPRTILPASEILQRIADAKVADPFAEKTGEKQEKAAPSK